MVMGVSGSGKSTIGALLAQTLDCAFLEGDEFHTERSIAKMAAGIALDDDDRTPWLQRLGEELGRAVRNDEVAVATCSALKRKYRDGLRAATRCATVFVHLEASETELAHRIAARRLHYMPISLLDSQLATLEPPQRDEWARTFMIGSDAARLASDILAWLKEERPDRLVPERD